MISSTRFVLISIVFLLIFTAALQPINDADFWWHLKTGQYITQTHTIPHTDVFSNTRFGSEWVAHEWLSEVFIYFIFRALGFAGLITVFAALITISFWIVYRRFSGRVGHLIAGFALVLGAAATTPVWSVRPQIFSLLIASIFLNVLASYYRSEQALHTIWWLIPLMVLWVNMHAAFAIGLAFIALTIMGLVVDIALLTPAARPNLRLRLPPLLTVFVVSCAVVCFNPNGVRMYSYPFETLRSDAMMRFIEEWRSPDFHQPHFQALALLLLATFSAIALSNKRVRPGQLLMVVVIALATLRSARNVGFFSLVATPLLAEHLWDWLGKYRWADRFTALSGPDLKKQSLFKIALNLSLIGLGLVMMTLGVRRAVAMQPMAEAQKFPVAAVDFMAARPLPEPIYNEYIWGGYLIWRLYPQYRVYIDGRADVYGDTLVEESLRVLNGNPGWRELLNKYGTRMVLVKPDSPLASLLTQESGWQNVFEDRQAVIFVRQ